MTEDEAKKKWCPMARQIGTLIGRRDARDDDRTVAMGSQNRGYAMGKALDNCMCLGSDCAMWRWARVDVSTPKAMMPGFCGLAGKPWDALG